MADSFALSVQVVVPLVVYMGIGGIIRRKGWMSPSSVKEMNDVVFKVLLSTMVFYNIYQSDLEEDFDLGLLLYAVAVLFVSFGVLCMAVGRKVKNRSVAPVLIQGIYRSNFVLFGLQVTASICGDGQLGMATVLISVVIPLFNVLAVILFECYRQQGIHVRALGKGIFTNPLIIASALGLLAVFCGIHLGAVLEDALNKISGMATPMSLILLGATITFEGIRKYWKYTALCAIGRLLLIPGVFLPLAVLLGFRGAELVALMVMFGSPTAVSSFPMASQMGGNAELAGQIVAVTTVFSTVTIFFWTYVLSIGGFI